MTLTRARIRPNLWLIKGDTVVMVDVVRGEDADCIHGSEPRYVTLALDEIIEDWAEWRP